MGGKTSSGSERRRAEARADRLEGGAQGQSEEAQGPGSGSEGQDEGAGRIVNTPSPKFDGFSAKPRTNVPTSRPKASSRAQCEKPAGSDHACLQERAFPCRLNATAPLREF